MKQLITIVLTLVLVGCETPPIRREALIAEHADWDAQTVKMIRAGLIGRGMSKEQVRTAWGHPCYPCTGTTEGIWGESWEFRTQVVFFDTEGRVSRWAPK